MGAGVFTPTKGETDDPYDGEYHCHDPQQMEREPRTEQDQYEQQSKDKQHDVSPS